MKIPSTEEMRNVYASVKALGIRDVPVEFSGGGDKE